MKPPFSRLFGLITLVFATHTATADLAIIDQQNEIGSFQTGPIHDTGQSFTPTLSTLDTIVVLLSTFAPDRQDTVYLDLFSGAGYGGTLLGTSERADLNVFGGQQVEFHFPSIIDLAPGNTYTFRIGGSYFEASAFTNPYAGGTEFYTGGAGGSNGTAIPERDLVFAEGLSVPEPATVWMFLLGSLIALTVSVRKIRFNAEIKQ